jgi:hypothetical protein
MLSIPEVKILLQNLTVMVMKMLRYAAQNNPADIVSSKLLAAPITHQRDTSTSPPAIVRILAVAPTCCAAPHSRYW